MLSVATRFSFDLQTAGKHPSLQVTKGAATCIPSPDQNYFNGHDKSLLISASEQVENTYVTSDNDDSDYDEATMYENFDCDRFLPSGQPPDRISQMSDICSKKNISTKDDICSNVSKFGNKGNKGGSKKKFRKVRCSKTLVRKNILRGTGDEFSVGTLKRQSNTENVETKCVYDSAKLPTVDDVHKAQELDMENSYDRFPDTNYTYFSHLVKDAGISDEESTSKTFKNNTINFDLSQLQYNTLEKYTCGRKPSDKRPRSGTGDHIDSSDNDQLFNNNKRCKIEPVDVQHGSNRCVDIKIEPSEVIDLISQNKENNSYDTKDNKKEITTIERPNCEEEITSSGSTNKLVLNKGGKTSSQKNHKVVTKHKRKKAGQHTCDQCFREFKGKYKLREHYSIHTGEKPYVCDICGMNFRSSSNLSSHKRCKHSQERNYCCKLCFKSYKTSKSLRLHMDTHNKTRFKCDTCGKDYSAHHRLKNHIAYEHADIFGYAITSKCSVCDKKFSCMTSLKLHIQIHEGNQRYGCDLCGSLFSRKCDRDRHRMIHTGEKPYKCDKCEFSCIQPGDFNRHKSMHTGESRHKCPHCDKTLVRKVDWKAHVAKHISNEIESVKATSRTTCKLCDAVFKLSADVLCHIKESHSVLQGTGITCSECGKSVDSKYLMKLHMRQEHNMAAFGCDVCGLEFNSMSNLNRHKNNKHADPQTRSQIKVNSKKNMSPEPCPICGKAFKLKEYMTEHVRAVHEKIKRFECNLCGKKFLKNWCLQKHKEKPCHNENTHIQVY